VLKQSEKQKRAIASSNKAIAFTTFQLNLTAFSIRFFGGFCSFLSSFLSGDRS
jgi:hypothetical protein